MSYVIQDSVLKFKDPMKPPNSIIYTYDNFENFASTNILLNLYSKTGEYEVLGGEDTGIELFRER